MNTTTTSHSYARSSNSTSAARNDEHRTSVDIVGLPPGYKTSANCASHDLHGLPSHLPGPHKNCILTLYPALMMEELKEFDEMFDDSSCKTTLDCSMSASDDSSTRSSYDGETPGIVTSSTTPQHMVAAHRRRRTTEIACAEDYNDIIKSSNEQRRKQNQALGAKDFHDKILVDLFRDPSPLE